jgi:hypothetical protein
MTTLTLDRQVDVGPRIDERDGYARAIAARAIQRSAADPYFVGHALAVCEQRFGVDEEVLARYLGCTTGAITDLALSHLPDPEADG